MKLILSLEKCISGFSGDFSRTLTFPFSFLSTAARRILIEAEGN
jgi:hypothetical protein